jgi:signal transduction histidine kinase/DNA-binding response OmpR family regulator/ligand-binding sensor domain-containing protein
MNSNNKKLNIILRRTNFSFIFSLCFIIIAINSLVTAQNIQTPFEIGFPIVKNYVSKEYSANVQNWSVIQDKRGVMYFGNGEGVLEYDGVSWRLIKVPNEIVRCLALDKDGKIFVGGINEIGYLEADSSGLLKYVSLNKYISKDKINFGDVWRIIVNDDGLYFQTFTSLFLLESNKNKKTFFLKNFLDNHSVQRWESRTRFNPIHAIEKRIFVHERNIGLQELVNGKFILLPGGEEFAQDLICIMLPYSSSKIDQSKKTKNILIGSLRRGMFLFDGSKFNKFNNEADNYLIENRLYYRGAILADGSYALGTQIGGIVVIDQQGKLKRIFNKNTGINNNTIWDLFPDREGNLWAALDNGIAKILYPSSSKILNEKSGFEGTIHAINNFDGKIYVATSSGIYFFQHESHNQNEKVFNSVPGISVQSWDLLPLNNKLFAATNDGIIEIVNNKPSIIDVNLRYVYCLYKSLTDSTIIYAGLHNGLAVLKNEKQILFVVGVLPNFQDGILDIQEDAHGSLWLSDIAGKIIRIKTPTNKSDLTGYKRENISIDIFSKNKTKLLRYQNQIYFYNSKNVLMFDRDLNKFIPSKLFQSIFTDSSQNILHIYSADDNSLWCAVDENGKTLVLEVTPNKNTPSVITHSFLEIMGDDFSSAFMLLKFFVDENYGGNLWVSDENNLVQYAINKETNLNSLVEIKPLIRRVSSSDGSILFNGYGESSEFTKGMTEIIFSQNSIVFEFASPSYVNEAGNDYQYMLDGFNDVWSNWNHESKKEYTNLSSGNFVFKVRTRDALGNISEEAAFSFRILPPWYKTWWANLLGFIIVLLFINYVIRFRVGYLKNKNIVLEKLVNERTAKINEQKETLENQAKKLLELDQLKSDFFANISHEFRTPLTLIKGQLENVLGMVKDATVKKKLNIAFNNSHKLNRLINQVLDLSKLESGKMKLEFELTNIVPLLRNRIASFESLAEQNKVTIEFNSNIETLQLNIDKEKIEEVIDNLLSNAFKFTPQNGKISLMLVEEKSEFAGNAVITISDTGIGIPENKLEHIFDRFYQADNSSTKQFEGTGLGLSIVKELIELHGGSITVTSKVNSGTRFSIYLPIEETELILSAIDDESTSENIPIDEDKPLILIVEDNAEVRNYIKENLEKHYRIDEAVNGEEGINKAINIIPDLIITDVMMPKVDGFELCNKLKNDQRTSHIPIVILTAKADEENKLDGLQIGADEFLAKPFSPRELDIRVGNLIRIRQLLREKFKEISVISPEDVKANPIDRQFLEKVFTLIKDHLEDQQFSVQKLADNMAMSVSQLNRKLNALINQSAGKLIRATKLDYAAKLLEKNAGNITEIAYRVGFSDVSSFTNSFKEKFGISPSEFLKKN